MGPANLDRLKRRLAAVQADVDGLPSAHELELAAEEIEALWDELHQQADYLARERERNAVLFDRAPFACIITDTHGNVRETNLAALALLDIPSLYLIGKPLVIFVTDEERDAFRRALIQASDPARPVAGWASQLKSPSGRASDVHIDVRLLPAHGETPPLILWFLRVLD